MPKKRKLLHEGGMLESMAPRAYLDGNVDPDEMERLFREAARLWRLNPWKRLDESGPMAASSPGLFLSRCCVGLSADGFPGILITSNLDVYKLAASLGQAIAASEESAGRVIPSTLEFSGAAGDRDALQLLLWAPASFVPETLRAEAASHGWEIAHVDAFPVALWACSAMPDEEQGTIRGPSWWGVRRVTGVCAALARLLESRPENKRVSSPFRAAARVEGSEPEVIGRVFCPHPGMLKGKGKHLYEPEIGPDLDLFLAQGGEGLLADMKLYHEEVKPHPLPGGLELHSMMHLAAETQLIMQSPEAIDRYTSMMLDGMSRHEIIHRLGFRVVEQAAKLIPPASGKKSPGSRSPKRR